jgi:carbon monoxide dehydrogenase subunit G
MSVARKQAHISAPVEKVWALVGDPNRHPEWWPGFVDVECEGLEQGCDYRAVIKGPIKNEDHTVFVERLDDCREVFIRCGDNGTYMRWQLAEAQKGTFVDVEFGMEPTAVQHRVFDVLAGKRYFRRWMEQSLDALEQAACPDQV